MKLNSETIRAIREVKGYSYRKLAKLSGLSPTLLYYLEHGERVVTDDVNKRLISAFAIFDQVTLEAFLELHRELVDRRREKRNG